MKIITKALVIPIIKMIGSISTILFLETGGMKAQTTDLFFNPFNKLSAHHRPIGTNAVYGILKNGTRTRGRLSVINEVALAPATGVKYLNRVEPGDPMKTILWNGDGAGTDLPFSLRIPTDADMPPWSPGSDNCALFFPRNGDSNSDIADLFFQVGLDPNDNKYYATIHKSYSIRGTDVGGGTSASRIKFPAGVMRGFELINKLPIQHCLQVAVSRKDGTGEYHILSKTYRWPATGMDGNANQAGYNLGDIPYGTRCAIRPQDAGKRETLGLTEIGKLLFDAHLYYGVLVVDGTGSGATGGKWNYRIDQDISSSMRTEITAQLKKIVPLLWPIDNTVENEEFAGGGPSLGGINTAWDAGITTSMMENNIQHQFLVFPNPSSGIFNIQCNANDKNLKWNISDITGRIIHSAEYENYISNTPFYIDLDGFSDGIYILKIQTENYSEVIKLIRQN